MKSVFKSVLSPVSADSVERTLSRYYARLVEWSLLITRGDKNAAEEIVQDLCLRLTLVQNDLSAINDLDGYLYICLRNMYISLLARVSRERLRVIQVEDYDEVGMAIADHTSDSVDVQNELMRICDYVMLRKYSSKSASHFILHFLLGYHRSDVALLARLPIAAIYNKLKDIRSELRKHLSSTDGIRVVPRGTRKAIEPLRVALSSDVFLQKLRTTILDGDRADCIAEEELIASYKVLDAPPVACRELAHLAGCERCLEILERALRLDDRDGPLDGLERDVDSGKHEPKSFDATMRIVRRRREQLLERRPELLAIAVDGRVVAFHAIESAHNSLSSRVDDSSTARFIEVFDEFGDRLAHFPLDAEATSPPRHRLSQQVLLSDDRRLQLDVQIDGLGIRAEATYEDPALTPTWELNEALTPHAQTSFWSRLRWPKPRRFASWSAAAFASILVVAALGIAAYRYTHPGWREALARSEAVAEVPSATETLHQNLQIEEGIGPAKVAVLGSVDIWRKYDGKVVRRLYNVHEQLLAISVTEADGSTSDHIETNASIPERDRQFAESGVWRGNVSAAAFETGPGASAEAIRSSGELEVSQRGNIRDGILLRTLVLDSSYHVREERVRFRTANGISEIRLAQTLLRRVPNTDVPPLTFPPLQGMAVPGAHGRNNLQELRNGPFATDANSADLEVAALYELFKQSADTGQPIEVTPISGGRIRMMGTLTDVHLVEAIRANVAILPNSNRIDVQIHSVTEAASGVRRPNMRMEEIVGPSSDAPAAALVRDRMIARGLQGEALKKAEQDFANAALAHAQAALQNAYALDRLGSILQRVGGASLNPDSRVKWAQMVDRHSAAVVAELAALRLQLNSISAGIAQVPSVDAHAIGDAAAFVRATSKLRVETQSANEQVVELFAGSAANLSPEQIQESINRLQVLMPVAEASRMNLFASRLFDPAAQNEMGEMHPR